MSKTQWQLREEQLKICPTLQSNPMYRYMMFTNQMGHLSHAISYIECAKIDEERYGKPEDYKGELIGAIADCFSMLNQICFQFDLSPYAMQQMANDRLEEFNKTRIPRVQFKNKEGREK